ncbi:hypothetical protein AYO21_06034 [Fonsecaea monophora]|uniref:Phosphatidylinositol N-acetylglucosaminyltransferase subunit H conserved domain-containing protein n=1 Tax=Fonsecaea monophora TaxID=254056 RepID=A0A177F988_9EURO|nr:hypothetical protein AYO21_06034 [Fonsecaea monophora]KAH0832572.1 phosphatidylinositol N-acetylglucosaminyltransferase [Fonsecaea pedrosoi]OAG39759.1 hypothetical protein AYO21_06034 [Fonsecaea monophora]
MFTGPRQYLSIHLPSPTTVSFTVSTREPVQQPASLINRPSSSHLLHLRRVPVFSLLKHALRILLVLLVLLVNLTKARIEAPRPSSGLDAYADLGLKLSLVGGTIGAIADRAEWWVLAPVSLIVVYACLRRDYVEESLLVLQGLGIQTSTSSRYFFTGPTTTFIPTTQIQDIVIHEAFKGLEVRFYLAVIVEGATEVVVVFPVSSSTSSIDWYRVNGIRTEADRVFHPAFNL